MTNDLVIGGSGLAILTAVIGFIKHLLDKRSAIREILEKQIDQLEKRNLEVEKKNDELTDQLIKRGRGPR